MRFKVPIGYAVVAVPIFKRLGLASVLGYLAAGSVIGPAGLGLIRDVKSTMGFAEFGVVLRLFIIGLELKPSRLWVLRKSVFGLGGAQVLATAIPFALIAWAFGLSSTLAIVVGVRLAFSSTAFALQLLGERRELSTKYGRSAFSILLFQDLAAIPLLAAVPLLSHSEQQDATSSWLPVLTAAGTIALLIIGGRLLLRPAFRLIASTRTSEIFTAASLLLVLGVAVLMESIGLSMALGSFLAGILLADSEYRHELEADIEPFKGLLLGLFFMTVGMTVDYRLILENPLLIAALVATLMTIKGSVIYFLGRWSGLPRDGARNLAIVLPQGGEFAFDDIAEEENPVIVAGFGRVGQITGRLLRLMDFEVTALDHDADQIEVFKKYGSKVYYGDASKLDLLKAAGAEKAKLFILAIDDVESSVRTASVVRAHFPHLTIIARARNRRHAFELMDLGVTRIWRETFASSLEMGEAALVEFGYSRSEARAMIEKFREHDDEMLIEQHKVYRDEGRMIDVSKQAVAQLAEVLQNDREDRAKITT